MQIDKGALLTKLQNNRTSAFNIQQRRHDEWKENYQLYRDKVIINRLTQRQSVNVPLMKETLRTILSKIDDTPDITFQEKGNEKQKEIFLNEYWKFCFDKNKLEVRDIVDKKQVALYGRSFIKLNIADGRPYIEVLDPQDILVDRFADPADLDTAQFIIHTHIFRTLKEVADNSNYDREAISRLKLFYATQAGLIKSTENAQSLNEKNEKLSEMGVPDMDSPQVGETIVELNENYIKLWDEKNKEFVLHLATTLDSEILMVKPFKEILNIDFYPIITWADDVERTDIWSDGIADIVRTPNKILNSWFSQLTENRTLRNFGMNYYDSTADGFVPQSFEPTPWGWYPIPGDPNKLVKRVDIPELSESLNEMSFIISMVERSTAATATEKGTSEKGQITLGEVQLMTAKANERITSIAKFYRLARKELGEKWMKLVLANPDKLEAVKLYKKSYKGNFFEKEISPEDWKSETGYDVQVVSTAEQEQQDMQTIERYSAVAAQFADNPVFQKINKKKLLDLVKLTPEETKEVMDFEEQKGAQIMPGEAPGMSLPINQPLIQPA